MKKTNSTSNKNYDKPVWSSQGVAGVRCLFVCTWLP